MKTRLARPAARLLAVLPLLCLTFARTTTAAAAPFTNLDFEQATVVVNDPMFGLLDWDLALPGWEGPGGVFYGTGHLGMGRLTMLTEDGAPEPWSPPAISGRFSVYVRNGAIEQPEDNWISQTGDLPGNAKAIEFVVQGDKPQVYLNGVQLTLVEFAEPFRRRFAANVVPFAGTTAELKILYPGNPNYDPDANNHWGGILDDFAFTQRIVPEPSTWALALLGLAAAFAFRRRR